MSVIALGARQTVTYSEHSPKAATNFPATVELSLSSISSLLSEISSRAATALATTVGFWSANKSLKVSLDLDEELDSLPKHLDETFTVDYFLAIIRRIQLGNTARVSSTEG